MSRIPIPLRVAIERVKAEPRGMSTSGAQCSTMTGALDVRHLSLGLKCSCRKSLFSGCGPLCRFIYSLLLLYVNNATLCNTTRPGTQLLAVLFLRILDANGWLAWPCAPTGVSSPWAGTRCQRVVPMPKSALATRGLVIFNDGGRCRRWHGWES